MNADDIRDVIRRFLQFVENPPHDPCQRDLQLLRHLDELAHSQHFVDYVFDDRNHPEPPELTKNLRDLLANKFPGYGYYNVPDTLHTAIAESPCIIGDAIDDIHDIVSELREVDWLWSNTSPEDALFHFQTMYRSHWQHHLRWLQVYVSERD